MRIHSLISEFWHMDGGVAFGVVPRSIWGNQYPSGADNLIPIVNRILLAESDNRLILVDTGFGHKRDEKYYQYKYITQRNSLPALLNAQGFSPEEVTDVIFTHLHDDHCGGAVVHNGIGLVPQFPNATHWLSGRQYRWATEPNARESASYFHDNIDVLFQSGLITLVEEPGEIIPGVEVFFTDGHTGGQMIPLFHSLQGTVAFLADFIPSKVHLPVPYLASVDIQPLKALEEKTAYLKRALGEQHLLFFQHDYFNEMCRLSDTPKGIRGGESFTAASLYS
ncbi:MAG TPA: MBL fold metallo-hydrolase [Bacteroidales bacterium]|nr:MBL fold metallo-hydrolase [Bacteroidales bacterium]HRZ48643.1 MBL fold metallo-hydrolase [Bacteroidales bacterium]